MDRPLFTIGYEGRTLQEFLDALSGAGAELLIDIRAVAASRRPGFSKTALAGSLREVGIDYVHLRPLGTPKAGRDAARRGRIDEMRRIYEDQLATPEAQLALQQAEAAALDRRTALLCFERDAGSCHRAIVAERLEAQSGFEVRNL
ncbi:MAG TPA: DUF488 domain-containing protein [Allosphingosinicella sp.]|jgi:uncharacterized protein (DUF488 family)|uniref:DUF488 domain-containing protein n=1 Tax=Allosphingosinicella sp. TaxID=2823234 RepID=UPI002F28C7BC